MSEVLRNKYVVDNRYTKSFPWSTTSFALQLPYTDDDMFVIKVYGIKEPRAKDWLNWITYLRRAKMKELLSRTTESVAEFILKQKWYRVQHWAEHSDDPNMDGRVEDSSIEGADVVSSETQSGLHRPVLDIDLPVALAESSTPGHYHLFIAKNMTWERYEKLLVALVEAGIVQQGFLEVARKRKATMVRLPWVKKEQ